MVNGAIIVGWILLIVAGYLTYQAAKTKETKIMNLSRQSVVIALAVIALLGLFQTGVLQDLAPQAGIPAPFGVVDEAPTEEVPEEAPTDLSVCVKDVDVTLGSYNAYKRGSDSTGDYPHRVFLKDSNGDWIDKGEYAEGASLTLGPLDTVRVLARFNETDVDGSGSDTYPHMVEEQLPCNSGVKNFDIEVYDTDSDPKITIWNEDNQVITDGTDNNQSMTSSTEYQLPFKIKASNDVCFGNKAHPGEGNIMCVEYNKSVFQSFEVDGAMGAYRPDMLESAAGLRADCYYMPVICDNADYEGTLIAATASVEPSTADHYPEIKLYDTSMDIDEDYLFDKPVIYDVQDEDGEDLGLTTVPSAEIGVE